MILGKKKKKQVKKKLNFSDKCNNIKEKRYSEYHQSQSNAKNH